MTIVERILSKVLPEPNSGCWLYSGNSTTLGYGVLFISGKQYYTHRIIFENFKGQIPKGLVIDHRCRVTCCCNPDHLDAIPQRENIRRGIKGVLTTHCPKGHPYDSNNTYYRPSGARVCRICAKALRSLYPRYDKRLNAARNS